MNAFASLITIIQVLTALGMIGLILIQHGKGADMGASFGSGGSGSLFGASGSANFLSRSTAVLATVFFVATLALAWLGTARTALSGSVLEGVTPPAVIEQPLSDIPGALPQEETPTDASAEGAALPQAAEQAEQPTEGDPQAGAQNPGAQAEAEDSAEDTPAPMQADAQESGQAQAQASEGTPAEAPTPAEEEAATEEAQQAPAD